MPSICETSCCSPSIRSGTPFILWSYTVILWPVEYFVFITNSSDISWSDFETDILSPFRTWQTRNGVQSLSDVTRKFARISCIIRALSAIVLYTGSVGSTTKPEKPILGIIARAATIAEHIFIRILTRISTPLFGWGNIEIFEKYTK